ncbi:MAG TPA: cupin domain-containing protein [Kofleriaceae bacterium]|nr:cupin domain-containing protein [Kofleriaceae bacterium]
MKKVAYVSLTTTVAGAAFFAGLSLAAPKKAPTFTAFSELQWKDVGGLQMADLWGSHEKGPYGALLKLPAGFTSPMHTHPDDYQAVMIQGTSSHWLVGEDGSQAKKLTPGSYWMMPGKLPHVSSCAAGQDCIMLVMQKSKFGFTQVGDDGKALPKSPAH